MEIGWYPYVPKLGSCVIPESFFQENFSFCNIFKAGVQAGMATVMDILADMPEEEILQWIKAWKEA